MRPDIMRAPTTGWHEVTLGEIADIVGGATPSTQNHSFWNGSIPWCTPTDLTGSRGKYVETTAKGITVAGLESCGARLLPPGAVLLCSRATVGEVRIAKNVVCTSQGLKSLICGDDVLSDFLYYSLLTRIQEIRRTANGSTFLEVGKLDLASIKICVPAREVQRAIVCMLSSVDETLESLERLITKKNDMKRETMRQLLTGEIRLPGFGGEWVGKCLGNVARINRGDIIPSTAIVPGLVPVVGAGIQPEHYHQEANRFEPVITVSASGANAGYVRYWKQSIWASDCCTITTRSWNLHIRYLAYYLEFVQDAIFALQHGGAQPHVYPKDLIGLHIMIPCSAEQKAVMDVLDDIDTEIEALTHLKAKMSGIRQGMMHELFAERVRSGESKSLVPGDAP